MTLQETVHAMGYLLLLVGLVLLTIFIGWKIAVSVLLIVIGNALREWKEEL